MLTDTLSPAFRALADPTRRWYLECLLDGDVRLVRFQQIFPIGPSAVLYHLRVLEKSGLLLSRKQGPMRLYSLRPEGLREAELWLRATYEKTLYRRTPDRQVVRF